MEMVDVLMVNVNVQEDFLALIALKQNVLLNVTIKEFATMEFVIVTKDSLVKLAMLSDAKIIATIMVTRIFILRIV